MGEFLHLHILNIFKIPRQKLSDNKIIKEANIVLPEAWR